LPGSKSRRIWPQMCTHASRPTDIYHRQAASSRSPEAAGIDDHHLCVYRYRIHMQITSGSRRRAVQAVQAGFHYGCLISLSQARSSTNSRFLVSLVSWCLVSEVVGSSFISKALLVDSVEDHCFEDRVPPVIAGRGGCPTSSTHSSSALPRGGAAAGGTTCCVAEGNRRCDPHRSSTNLSSTS